MFTREFESLESLFPTYATDSGSLLGCYLSLLHLNYAADQCFEKYRLIAASTVDLDSKLVTLLEHPRGGWRVHLHASAYLLIIGSSDSTRRSLWATIDRGSWVSPQLAVVAYLRDEQFSELASQRIKAAALGQSVTSAKALSSLLFLCKRIPSMASWLSEFEQNEKLQTFLTENDDHEGHLFAQSWLSRLKDRIGLEFDEPV